MATISQTITKKIYMRHLKPLSLTTALKLQKIYRLERQLWTCCSINHIWQNKW